MNLGRQLDRRVRRWGLVETKSAQAAAFFFALVLAKAFPSILRIDLGWWIALVFVCSIPPILRFFQPLDD